jgi:DNA-binding CsgD family transcriptional regulator
VTGAMLAESTARIAEAARSGDLSGLTDTEAHVARIVADAPPLTDRQRRTLAAILGGAR